AAVGPNGDTPLHYAAYEDRPSETAELLLDRGSHLERTNDAGETPLVIAGTRGNMEVGNVLLRRGAHVDLDSAALLGDADRVRELVEADPHLHGLRRPTLVLDLALRRGQKEIIKLLLGHGLDPNSGRPPLLTAVEMALNHS